MKTTIAILMCAGALAVAAQVTNITITGEETNLYTAEQSVEQASELGGAVDPMLALIPLITTAVIAGLKMLLPRVPTKYLPWLAPVIGALGTLLIDFAGVGTGNLLVGAVLGSAGVGLREIYDQTKQAAVKESTK